MAKQQIYRIEIWVDGERVAVVTSLDEKELWDFVHGAVSPYLIAGKTVELKEYYDNPDETKPN